MNTSRQHKGISLIEALIAAVVLSVGLIAIAKLQSDLVTSSGSTKARSEGVSLLEREIEQLRSIIVRSDFDLLSGVSTTADCEALVLEQGLTSVDGYEGTNAVYFLRDCAIETLTDLDAVQITLGMEWADPRNGQQTLALSSIVAWDDPMLVARLTTSDGTGSDPISRPSRPGGEGFKKVEGDDRPAGFPGAPTGDKTHDLLDDLGDPTDLADAKYVLLADGSLWELAGDGDGGLFQIQGRLFVDDTLKGGNALNPADFEIISSGDDLFPCIYNNLVTETEGDYQGFSYVCYKTEGWYGNIGIFYTGGGGVGSVPRVCVGDPGASATANIFSRHPQLAAVRIYRGYGPLANDGTGSFGSAGMDPVSSQRTYSEQNFLLTRLSRSYNCSAAMDNVDGTALFSSTPAGTDWKHPGFFVCLSGDEPVSGSENLEGTCPANLLVAEGDLETTISGTVTINDDPIELGPVTLYSGSFNIDDAFEVEACSTLGNSYECLIVWSGVPFNLRTDELDLRITSADIVKTDCNVDVTGQTSTVPTVSIGGLAVTITGVGAASSSEVRNVLLTCPE